MFVFQHLPFLVVALVSAVVAVALVRVTLTWGRLVLAVAVAAALSILFAAGATILRGSYFAGLHVLYLHAVVSLPAIGIAAASRPGGSRAARVVAAGLVLAAPVGVYATFVEPRTLAVETAEVPLAASKSMTRPIVVAVLADIQTRWVGPHELRAVDAALQTQPDIIVIPGDVYQGGREDFAERLPALRKLLGSLRAPGGVFVVVGNADTARGLRAMTVGTDVRVLVDQTVRTTVRGQRVMIAGISLDVRSRRAQASIQELRDDPNDAVRIVVAHRPDTVLTLPADDVIDLTIAGHTHGGQLQIPGIGPLMTLSDVPDEVAAGGLHHVHGNAVYVSRGIGIERGDAPPLRLFCPPEVSILSLA